VLMQHRALLIDYWALLMCIGCCCHLGLWIDERACVGASTQALKTDCALMQHRALVIEHRALLMRNRALLKKHMALLMQHRALLMQHRALLMYIGCFCPLGLWIDERACISASTLALRNVVPQWNDNRSWNDCALMQHRAFLIEYRALLMYKGCCPLGLCIEE